MKKEQQRIAIAEACGWKLHENQRLFEWESPSGAGWNGKLPEYENDLNAMHNAEKTLTLDQKNKYINILSDLTFSEEDNCAEADFKWSCATAGQRAEAFLKTLNRWKP